MYYIYLVDSTQHCTATPRMKKIIPKNEAFYLLFLSVHIYYTMIIGP